MGDARGGCVCRGLGDSMRTPQSGVDGDQPEAVEAALGVRDDCPLHQALLSGEGGVLGWPLLPVASRH